MIYHQPVMLKEVIELLDPRPGENFVDCTLGDGGHAVWILKRTSPGGRVLGIDLDQKAIRTARERIGAEGLDAERLITVCDNFRHLRKIIRNLETEFPSGNSVSKPVFGKIHGALLDLGLRQFLLEESGRGFSFQKNEPLDMRYGDTNDSQMSAAEIVKTWSESDLRKLFKEYGEERLSREIAREITEQRKKKPVVTTTALRNLILEVYRGKLKTKKQVPWIGGIHPATRVFMALRIAVNDEFGALREVLPQAVEILEPGGRLAVISFHSGEDRIVKRFFKSEANKTLKILTKKPITPGEEEARANPMARSAKLRAAQKYVTLFKNKISDTQKTCF